MKIIALGSNLPGRHGEPPKANLQAALEALPERGITPVAVSSFYASEPVPASGQPWYVNGAAEIETRLGPEQTLQALLAVEEQFGRVRLEKNEARIIDLDLIDYDGLVVPSEAEWLAARERDEGQGFYLPHLRAHARRFVLQPLLDIAPEWQHPVYKKAGKAFLAGLPAKGKVVAISKR